MTGSYTVFTPDCKLEERNQGRGPAAVTPASALLLPAAHDLLCTSRQQEGSVVGRASWVPFADLAASAAADGLALQETEQRYPRLE